HTADKLVSASSSTPSSYNISGFTDVDKRKNTPGFAARYGFVGYLYSPSCRELRRLMRNSD
ncbi:MAG TPA: hypothetical protein VJ086_03715, partial [Rubrobacteraceae bacterium]|nr:hypothetical protein [Rubrobacteraceae bacterium]